MILFIGSEEKGHFVRDVAHKHGWEARFLKPSLEIKQQVSEILACQTAKYIVYDIEQYANPAEEIAEEIRRIQLANNAEPVIYASGYQRKSDIIMFLSYKGIKNYIFGAYLSEKKEELENCISGICESEAYEFPDPDAEEKSQETDAGGKRAAKSIGIAGAVPRMGTTTQAIQFVKYLMLQGYKACYIEMNSHRWVEELADAYADVTLDERTGKVTYQEVDMYNRLDKLQEVLQQEYDYYIYDYGVYSDREFNKISFLEKDLQIFVAGTKPGEFMKTYELIENNFYNHVIYIFNFIRDDKTEHEDTYELMQEKRNVTYFAPDCRDPFIFSNAELYEQILPVEPVITLEAEKQKRRLFGKRKKNGSNKRI